ncbi:hypothetical protein C6P40_000351 [Pichia californica]|uniref:Uncharacterized protein n=1 Tax=Pichia californica TaxID=460514 RepID=A0A9P6WMM4_9ASCO|nr:hypothetical protein C6P42_000356 [[Candida] californica]KAG0688912.1 hypothetical protein C6P40_000351 [[Candida] californica]
MGLCLSCLNSNQTIQDEEDVSLLSDDKAKVIEDELLNELRNKQLNAILNSTNDHLIDISTFKSMSNYGSISQHTNINNDNDIDSQNQQDEGDILKVLPIPNSTIKEEMQQQYKEWSARLGQAAVRKHLEIKIDPKEANQKYTIDLV